MPRKRSWSDDQLIQAIAESNSWLAVLGSLGLSGGWNNVYTIRIHVERLGIDISHLDKGKGWSRNLGRDGLPIRTKTTKRCCYCGEWKLFEEFFKASATVDGYAASCKICKKGKALESNWKRSHGVTKEQAQFLLESQDHACAICYQAPEEDSLGRTLRLDHDHTTNKPRGFLCNSCNLLLGNAQDSTAILKSAIEYLGRFNGH